MCYHICMQKLICFDLDGTLTPHSTWLAFNTRLSISPEDDKRLFSEFLDGKITYVEWLNALMEIYKKNGLLKKADLIETAEALEISPGAQEAIAAARAKGYRIVIISGAVDIMASSFAKRLGVEDSLTINKALFD
jgi:HAD superfamily phosphoserine phosphatase-like hydrolase